MKIILVLLRSLVAFVCLLAIIFFLAGTMDYWQGWVFSGVMGVAVIGQEIIFARDPDLAKERKKPGKGVKIWDKVFITFFSTFLLSSMVIGILDTARFGWTQSFDVGWYFVGYLALILGTAGFLWPMWTNHWFATLVRIQDDRGHKVVQTGPYKFVRHPGYVGAIFMSLGIPLVFGSWWGMILAAAAVISLIIRTSLEDKTLQRELDGYKDYAKKVPYKLIPGIW
jgi:protein-S-isoprenylcysteine O-methyltransferase Ste14